MQKVFVLGVIPARGGSKGIKNKNIKELNGRPLINYTIEAAKNSANLDDFIVTTDSEKIATICRNAGANVPFKRPDDLATDTALAMDTIKHAVLKYEELKSINVDIVVMLQPTSPLRKSEHIDDAISKFKESGFDSSISVVNIDASHPLKMKKL